MGFGRVGQKILGFTPIKGLIERYYKKKHFSMSIFEKSLTKYFNWNKNYTKSSNIRISSSFGMVGTPCLEAKYRLCSWSANPW